MDTWETVFKANPQSATVNDRAAEDRFLMEEAAGRHGKPFVARRPLVKKASSKPNPSRSSASQKGSRQARVPPRPVTPMTAVSPPSSQSSLADWPMNQPEETVVEWPSAVSPRTAVLKDKPATPALNTQGTDKPTASKPRYWASMKFASMGDGIMTLTQRGPKSQHDVSGPATTTWADLISDPHVTQNLESVYTGPLPIHKAVIPLIKNGSSLYLHGPPSTGKMIGYLIPLLDQIMARKNQEGIVSSPSSSAPSVIVISPLCLLAGYIVQTASRLINGGEAPLPIKIGGAYGGIGYEDQGLFIAGADIVVMTPGRGLDLVKKHSISVERVQTLVIEEAETIFEEQFNDFVELLGMVKYHQVITVTVSLDKDTGDTIQRYLKPSLRMKRVRPLNSIDTICEQSFVQAPPRKYLGARISAFLDGLRLWQETKKLEMGQSLLVFTADYHRARAVKKALVDFTGLKDENVGLIHHEVSVLRRESVLEAFMAKKIMILVSTQQCGLGFTFPHMPFVVVFDVPVAKWGRPVYDEWATLVTRTGRLGHFGRAATFLDPVRDRDLMMDIREGFEKFERPVPDWFAARSKE